MRFLFLWLFLIPFCTILTSSCKQKAQKTSEPDSMEVVKKLFESYREGSISKCDYNGTPVYVCEQNAFDAGSVIYSETGEKLGECLPSTGMVPDICNQVFNCEPIWRVKGNIWGQPAVDVYGLDE